MNRRQRTIAALGTCGLAAALGLIAAGCAREETNEEFFQRTAPPGVSGPPQSYPGSGGQSRPSAPPAAKSEAAPSEGEAPPPAESAAPKDEPPAPTEAPPASEPPAAPAEDTKE